jgi:hypothetical protein
MPKYRSILPRLVVASIAAMLIAEGACNDAPTAPRSAASPGVSPVINAPGDSSAPELVFLQPLGPRKHPHGELDTTLAPAVSVCRLDADQCGADTVARFVSDPSAPDSSRVTLTEKAYTIRWNLTRLVPDSASAYRLTVMLGDTTVGYTDMKLVPDGYTPPPADTARYAFVTERRRLIARFQIFMPPESLLVIVEPGVRTTIAPGTTVHRRGERVRYRFDADTGYRNVLVTVDEQYVKRRGEVVMDGPHVLVASADRVASVRPGDEWMVHDGRALLRSANPVIKAQQLLDKLAEMTDTADINDRLERAARVLDQQDPAAVRALDAALTGHSFLIASGSGTDDGTAPQEPPSPPPGGGIATMRIVPRASRGRIGPAGPEPVTISYVNGILVSPIGALFSASQLARLVDAATWGERIPYEVRLIYAKTTSPDTSDAKDRCVIELARASDGLGVNALPVNLATCLGGDAAPEEQDAGALAMLKDLSAAGMQLGSVLKRSQWNRPEDVDTIAATTTRWRDAGRHVVFVPHSRGNLMVQQSVDMLQRRGLFRPSSDTTCIGAVPLAAPTSSNWPIGPRHLEGLVVNNDAILTLGSNHFEQVRTSLSDSAEADLPGWARKLIPGIAGSLQFKWRVRLHEFVNSYLNQEPMRTRIQQAIVHTYRSCALGDVQVLPEQMRLTTGQVGTFSTVLKDMNGDPLDGMRGVTWSGLANVDAQRGARVSSDGLTRAIYVGGTSVVAATRSMLGNGGVIVDAATLGVGVSEALSARWVLIDGLVTTVPGPIDSTASGRPETEFPTSWDGGSCTAKQAITLSNGAVGQFSKLCAAAYQVRVEPFANAARYEATFFSLGHKDPAFTISRTSPSILGVVSGPEATLDPLPGPELLDRVNVNAWDLADHLLASGTACAHRCNGWPGYQ